MNVIILYQHLVREWDASQRLRALYEEAGDNAIVCSIDFERVKAYKYAKKNIPDVILVPFFVDHEHEEWLSAFIDLNRDVKIINLHQEQIGSKFSVGLMLPRTPFTKNGSFHFAWGEYFKALLLSCGVKEENIIITGNSRNISGTSHIQTKKNWLHIMVCRRQRNGFFLQKIAAGILAVTKNIQKGL